MDELLAVSEPILRLHHRIGTIPPAIHPRARPDSTESLAGKSGADASNRIAFRQGHKRAVAMFLTNARAFHCSLS